jgi:acetyl-CoA carboxylase carboxyltransferase component
MQEDSCFIEGKTMTEQEEGTQIELLDLGDATIETRQSGLYALIYDSIFLLGEKLP